jgi:hypothetical protein
MLDSLPYRKPTLAIFGVIIALLFIQALFPRQAKPMKPQDLATEDCIGEPLSIPFAYTGNVVDPWSCQIQCQDKKQRYLVYTNGAATQCEILPGCNDFGEDHGETCRIPGGASIAPMSGTGKSLVSSQRSS